MKLLRYFQFFVLILGLSAQLISQNPCNYTAATTCGSAPIICDLSCLDGFVGLTPKAEDVVSTLPEQPPVICNLGGTPQNMSWFAFIAGSNYAKISITPFNCEKNKGIQAGIFDDCDFSDAVVNGVPVESEYIDCEFLPGEMETIVLESNSFIPGQIYYFYVDGNDGDVCSYKVDVISATQHFELVDLVKFTQTNDTVTICPNTSYELSVDSLKLDIFYYWKISPATDSLPFDTFTRLDSVMLWKFIDTGVYTISLYATNGCDITDTISKTFRVFNLEDEDFGTLKQCSNEFPYGGPQNTDPNGDGVFGWQGPNITGPGQSTYKVIRPDGCSYDQRINIDAIPLQARETVNLVDCNAFVYHDLILDDSYKDFPHTLPVKDRNGCDSLVMINAFVPRVQASLSQSACDNGSITVNCSSEVFSSPGGHTLTYLWKDKFGQLLTDNDTDPENIRIDNKTDLFLTISLAVAGKVCTYDLPSVSVDPSLELPLSPQANGWETELCKDQPLATYSVQPEAGVSSYNWTATNGAVINGNPTNSSVNIDFSAVNPKSLVCASAINQCGESNPVCLEVSLIEKPVISLPQDLTVCIDSVLTVSLVSNNIQGASYQWIYSGGNLVAGNPLQANPLKLKYNSPGNYIVSADAQNKTCKAIQAVTNVTVKPRIAQTTISYVSYANKVEVSWTAVPCAVSYRIYKNGVYQGATTFTQTVFDQLTSGITFDVTIEAEGADCACGLSTATLPVKTLSCDEVDITLEASSKIICEANWNTPVLLSAQLSGTMSGSGVSSWSGAGVLVSNEFLPSLVGAGNHKIYFNYSELGCVYKDSIVLLNVKTPSASVLPIDPECEGDDSGTIQVVPSNGSQGLSYYLDGTQVNGPSIQGVSIGNHQLEIIDANLCKMVQTVIINPPTYPTVDFIMDNGPYFDNQPIQITLKELVGSVGQQGLIDSIEWYVNGEIYCSGDCFTRQFEFSEGGIYSHLVVIYYKDCLMEKSFDIIVKEKPKLYVSNIFSVNNQSNGGWKIISNDASLTIREVSVFSRWGEQIFHGENLQMSEANSIWDGTFRGQKVMPGVYVYLIVYINEKGEEVRLTGDVTVIR